MKVLCVCPIGLGNYLLTYPACALLKKQNPHLELHLLALRNYIVDFAGADPLWHTVHVFDPTRIKHDFNSALSTIIKLRQEKFDVSINFFASNDWRYNLLVLLSGCKERYGFDYHLNSSRRLGFLLNHRIKVDPLLHDIRQNQRLAASLFNQSSSSIDPVTFPELYSANEFTIAQQMFLSMSTNPIKIAIHAGSSAENGMDAKRWEPANFAALADKLCTHFHGEAYLFGGDEERSIKQQVARAMQQPVHSINACSLRTTAAMLKQCSLCLCNDSGLMHIAACQQVPTVAIFGPTDEKRNGPWGVHTLVVRTPMAGFPVWKAANVGNRKLEPGVDPRASLKALSVQEAWEQILPWLTTINVKHSTE